MVLFGGHAWFYSAGGMCGFIQQGGRAWFFSVFRIQWDTVNERAVRILLECILVLRAINFIAKKAEYLKWRDLLLDT